jgi:hypothetical protein
MYTLESIMFDIIRMKGGKIVVAKLQKIKKNITILNSFNI